MKFKRKKRQGFLETCAASDLAFLLIIYFLVIAGFNVNKGFVMNLPAKDSTRMILREELLRFNMEANGDIYYSDEITNIQSSKAIIQRAQSDNPNIAVILTIDSETKWQNVVYFVELAQDLQIDSFSFSMKKESR